jgi:hypothetical protein
MCVMCRCLCDVPVCSACRAGAYFNEEFSVNVQDVIRDGITIKIVMTSTLNLIQTGYCGVVCSHLKATL